MKNLVLGILLISSVVLSVGAFAEKPLIVVDKKPKVKISASAKPVVTKISRVVSQPLKISEKKVSSVVKTIKISVKSKK